MPSKSRIADDTVFDRRRSSSDTGSRRATDRSAANGVAHPPRAKRATLDGRQPLVVYMQPESIKALKIAALEDDTTASAIVANAVSTWLRTRTKRKGA